MVGCIIVCIPWSSADRMTYLKMLTLLQMKLCQRINSPCCIHVHALRGAVGFVGCWRHAKSCQNSKMNVRCFYLKFGTTKHTPFSCIPVAFASWFAPHTTHDWSYIKVAIIAYVLWKYTCNLRLIKLVKCINSFHFFLKWKGFLLMERHCVWFVICTTHTKRCMLATCTTMWKRTVTPQ